MNAIFEQRGKGTGNRFQNVAHVRSLHCTQNSLSSYILFHKIGAGVGEQKKEKENHKKQERMENGIIKFNETTKMRWQRVMAQQWK